MKKKPRSLNLLSKDIKAYHGNCLEILPSIKSNSIDAVICDPPYPEIDRDYGRFTEVEWFTLMKGVCKEAKRVLKPTGSAMFVLQPNSKKVGSMRSWLFEFQVYICKTWNMIQDAYWWNVTSLPNVFTHRDIGLMRPSVKACIWCGPCDCYRNQDSVLRKESDDNQKQRLSNNTNNELKQSPSGYTSLKTKKNTTSWQKIFRME